MRSGEAVTCTVSSGGPLGGQQMQSNYRLEFFPLNGKARSKDQTLKKRNDMFAAAAIITRLPTTRRVINIL